MLAKTLKAVKNYRFRDSVTGRWVKKAFALLNPRTTQKEEIK